VNDNQAYHVAQIFQRQAVGDNLTPMDKAFLSSILYRMDAAESAGTISAIIQLMLKEN